MANAGLGLGIIFFIFMIFWLMMMLNEQNIIKFNVVFDMLQSLNGFDMLLLWSICIKINRQKWHMRKMHHYFKMFSHSIGHPNEVSDLET